MEQDRETVELHKGALVFEIGISSSGPWPPALDGCKPVVEQLQRMLEAAAQGNQAEFKDAKGEMEDAVWEWQSGLWGPK